MQYAICRTALCATITLLLAVKETPRLMIHNVQRSVRNMSVLHRYTARIGAAVLMRFLETLAKFTHILPLILYNWATLFLGKINTESLKNRDNKIC
jgi:hypothetical protein